MFERYVGLLGLLRAAGGVVDGRKKLQKIVYLIQQKGGPLAETFQYHLYGPFSEQLANEIEEMRSFGLVDEEEKRTAQGQTRYEYSLTKVGERLLASMGAGDRLEPFKELIGELATMDGRKLELMATALYLLKLKWPRSAIADVVKGLKSTQGYTTDEVSECLEYLEDRGFYSSAES